MRHDCHGHHNRSCAQQRTYGSDRSRAEHVLKHFRGSIRKQIGHPQHQYPESRRGRESGYSRQGALCPRTPVLAEAPRRMDCRRDGYPNGRKRRQKSRQTRHQRDQRIAATPVTSTRAAGSQSRCTPTAAMAGYSRPASLRQTSPISRPWAR